MEVLEDHPETVHYVLLAKDASPGESLPQPAFLAPSSAVTEQGTQFSPQSDRAGGWAWELGRELL